MPASTKDPPPPPVVRVLAAVERVRKRLWALCYRMTGNRAEADDLCQESIARATNYGNILSLFDRALGTFTPSAREDATNTGLDGLDDARTQRLGGLLRLRFGVAR